MRVLALLGIAAALPCAASSILGIYSDIGQNYTFTDTATGNLRMEPVAPYPGYIDGIDYGLICLDFLKTANWNTAYSGTLRTPTSEVDLESAYLATRLAHLYQPGIAIAEFAPISFAIWQLNDPAAGDVPRDAAAQPWVALARHYYSSGELTSANFPNTLIWVPDNPAIQPFMTMVPGVLLPNPEPGTVALLGGGLLVFLISAYSRPLRRFFTR